MRFHPLHPALCVALIAAGDPSIDWRTIETPHFEIHYDARNQALA